MPFVRARRRPLASDRWKLSALPGGEGAAPAPARVPLHTFWTPSCFFSALLHVAGVQRAVRSSPSASSLVPRLVVSIRLVFCRAIDARSG